MLTGIIALNDCFALGDTVHDIQILDMVAKPIALNPDFSLLSIAKEKGYLVADYNNILKKIEALL